MVRHGMSVSRWLDLAFSPIVRNKTLARGERISDTAVRLIRRVVAKTVLDQEKDRHPTS